MKKTIWLLAVLFIVILSSGCFLSSGPGKNENSEFATITGKTALTKDGYYVGGYFLSEDELSKYIANNRPVEIDGKDILITCKIREEKEECEQGVQCREGITKVLYDIQLIKVVKK